MQTCKHAYLLLVHKNGYVLEKLLYALDYSMNDIFIHVDKKSKDFDYEKLRGFVKKSNLYFIEPRIPVVWGGYSRVKAELALLKEATARGQYAYYHLLSGQDFPLVSQRELHNAMATIPELEYIDYLKYDINTRVGKRIYQRASVNHYFREYRERCYCKLLNGSVTVLDKAISGIEAYILRRDRCVEKGFKLHFGSTWFSITDDCARYVVSKERTIKHWFKYSSLPDELFLQTLIADSPYYQNVTENKRLLYFCRENDNSGKHPYVWKENDYEELVHSGCYFARKFDERVDRRIIDMLFGYINDLD